MNIQSSTPVKTAAAIHFTVGLNHKIVGKAGADKVSNAGAFSSQEVTIADLSDHISKGFPWMPALLDDGARRLQESSNKSFCLALDVDNSRTLKNDDGTTVKDLDGKSTKVYREELTIAQALEHPYLKDHCCLIQTSASHKPEWDKFRLVFLLAKPIENHALIRLCNRYLAHVMGVGDPACKDASRFFFGAPGSVPALRQEARLPDSFVADALEWDAEVNAKQEAERAAKQEYLKSLKQDSGDKLNQVRSALSFIAPYTPGGNRYNDLIVMCAGVVNDLGFEGESALIEWGGFGRDTEKKVRGLNKTVNKIATLGSLFYLAKQEGFRFPKREFTAEEKRAYAQLKNQERSMSESKIAPFRAVEVDESADRDYQEDLEYFQSDRDRLGLMGAARFSNESEEFWLGDGITAKSCGGIRPNIKNGWVAAAVAVGQILASLTPREVRIIPPDHNTSRQCSLPWILFEAKKSGGKSVIFESIKPFHDALDVLEWRRSKQVAEVRSEIANMLQNEETSEADKPTVNNALHSIEPSIALGDFSIAYLKIAMAAANYWPRLSKESRSRFPIKCCGTLVFCREAVQFFENLGAFNQRNSAAQSFLAGAWAGEVEKTGRKTGSELTHPGAVSLGMLLACQPNQFSQIIQNESARNAVDTGFGIRFDLTTLENTDRENPTFEPRDMTAEAEEKINLFDTLWQFHWDVGMVEKIECDAAAAALFEHELYPWIYSEDFSGWLDGYASKAVATTLRLAWAFRCIEIFDAIHRGDRPTYQISGSAMNKAIEKTKLSLASLRFHVANLENERTITAKLKESEQQSSLVKSKYGAILTDPQLTHDFVSGHRSQGIKTFRSLLQRINSKSKKELKEIGLDAAAILRPVWDEMEAQEANPTVPPVATAGDPIAEFYEYQGD